MRSVGVVLALAALMKPLCAGEPTQMPLWTGGTGGYKVYRIPSLIVTPRKSVVAFCEARKNSASDAGDIDVVMKRSTDGGKTWSGQSVIWNDADNTCGNPCPVIDAKTGDGVLLLTHNLGGDREKEIATGKAKGSRSVWLSRSADDGVTWSKPIDITAQAKRSEWTWYATGPGVGIQLKTGRLLIPCDHMTDKGKTLNSHVILSDDGGKTWRIGGVTGPECNECQAVELADGTVMLNMRSYRKNNRRLVSMSEDGGQTFSAPAEDLALIDPICQASIFKLNGGDLIFSNAASTKRENLTVRLSRDEGKTWPASKSLHAGPSAYSCLAVLPNGEIGCLYERGEKMPYETITFSKFPTKWLTD
jgi:sialidase-1